MTAPSYSVLLVNGSDKYYQYILSCLSQCQLATFKLDWLKNDPQSALNLESIQLHYDLYLIEDAPQHCRAWVEKVYPRPVVVLLQENQLSRLQAWLEVGASAILLYPHLNPLVIEHFFQKVLGQRRYQEQARSRFRQVNEDLRQIMGETTQILTKINDLLLDKLDESLLVGEPRQILRSQQNHIDPAAPLGILRSDRQGQAAYFNPAFLALLNLPEEDALGELWFAAIHPQERAPFLAQWRRCHEEGCPFTWELRFQNSPSRTAWVYLQVLVERHGQGVIQGTVTTATDITQYKQYEHRLNQEVQAKLAAYQAITVANQQLKLLAQLDRLTQIPNFQYFEEYFLQEWRRAQEKQLPLSLIYLDVENFQRINHRYDYETGDAYLKTLAGQIHQSLKRPRDLAARYGGDEFVVILPDTPLSGAKVVADSLRQNLTALPDLPEPVALTALAVGGLPNYLLPGQGLLSTLKGFAQSAGLQGGERLTLAPLTDWEQYLSRKGLA
ncbi:MAG: sensor domain-containing diguanylate cyclase [Cyanobacteriota bacterium]|nr:sensor domain-containing diguanylate cyclase [Cyanobacteriota bacterium]